MPTASGSAAIPQPVVSAVPTALPTTSGDGFLLPLPTLAAIPSGTAAADVPGVSADVKVERDPDSGVVTYAWGPVTVLQTGSDAPVVTVAPGGALPGDAAARTLVAGTGSPDQAAGKPGDVLLLKYAAVSAATGEELASTWARGAAATVRQEDLPLGWARGIDGMVEGERRLLAVPSALSASPTGKVFATVPPGDTMVVLVDLMDVVRMPTAAPTVTAAPTAAPTTAPTAAPTTAPATAPTAAPATAPPTLPPAQEVPKFDPIPLAMLGLHVPQALQSNVPVGGQEYAKWDGQWPDVQFGTLRLWDTRTTWAMLEPSDGEFTWNVLDGQIAQAKQNGVSDFVLVLGGTPQWAASGPAPDSATWVGPDSASPPASEQAWVEFVTAAATRYKGVIRNYQIWNEPNSRLFWQGTPEQLARLVASANKAIKAVDPSARVIGPGLMTSEKVRVRSARKWWAALADKGWPIDIAALHAYPSPQQGVAVFSSMIADSQAILADLGWRGPLWITEASYLNRSGEPITAQQARELVARTIWAARAAGAQRIYWYAWSPPIAGSDEGELLLLQPGTDAAAGFADAYNAGRS